MDTMINISVSERIKAITRREMKEGFLPDNCITCYWLHYWFDNDGKCMGHLCSEKPEVRGSYEECCNGRLKGCPYEKEGAEMNMQQMTINDAMAENEKTVDQIVAAHKSRKTRTQADKILEYIRRHGSITQMDANMLGVFRLAARVYDINNSLDPKLRGIHIIAEPDEALNQDGEIVKFARYRLG